MNKTKQTYFLIIAHTFFNLNNHILRVFVRIFFVFVSSGDRLNHFMLRIINELVRSIASSLTNQMPAKRSRDPNIHVGGDRGELGSRRVNTNRQINNETASEFITKICS